MTKRKPPEEHKKPGRPAGVFTEWTLDMVKARCNAEDDDECWDRYEKQDGFIPSTEHQKRFAVVMHKGERIMLRRLAFKLAFPDVNIEGKAIVQLKCNNPRCHNPHHAKPLTERQKCKRAADRGSFSSATRSLKIAATKQEQGKLNWDKVREIRACTLPYKQEPWKNWGISETMWKRIRSHKAWKEISSPMARMVA